jgi:hypothetical protein
LLTSKNAREFFVSLSEQAGKNNYNRTGASVFENETADLCLRVHLSPGAEIRRDIKSVVAVSGLVGAADAEGNANPDNDFRFDSSLGVGGGYIFNLSTKGLNPGTYRLQFTVTGDPIGHSVLFGVK